MSNITRVMRSPMNPLGISPEIAEDAAVQAALQVIQGIDALNRVPYFKTLWEHFGEKVAEQAAIALDPTQPPAVRDIAVHVHAAMKDWHTRPQAQHEAALERVQASEQRKRQRENMPPASPL